MRAQTARGSFLDPRTKILIWLLANVVVFTWAPTMFRITVMLAYFGLFLRGGEGEDAGGPAADLPCRADNPILAASGPAGSWLRSCHC